MTIGETVRKAIKEISEGLLDLMTPKDFNEAWVGGKAPKKKAKRKTKRKK